MLGTVLLLRNLAFIQRSLNLIPLPIKKVNKTLTFPSEIHQKGQCSVASNFPGSAGS